MRSFLPLLFCLFCPGGLLASSSNRTYPSNLSLFPLLPNSFWELYAVPLVLILALGGIALVLILEIRAVRLERARLMRASEFIPARVGIVDETENFIFLLVKPWFRNQGDRPIRNLADLPGGLGETFAPVIRAVFADGRSRRREYTLDGVHRRAFFSPLDGDVFGRSAVMWISFDMEDEFRQREQIKMKNELLVRAASMAQLVYYDGGFDLEKRFVLLETLFTIRLHDGKSVFPLQIVDAETAQRYEDFKKSFLGGGVSADELELSIPDGDGGERLFFLLRVNRCQDGLGLITVQNVSAAKRTEAALRDASIAAQAADKSKSYFIATMSHELRTPLNAIVGYSELLKKNHDDPERLKTGLETIHFAGNTLLTMVNDILDLSRLDAGKTELINRPVDLPPFFERIASFFRARIEEKKLDFKLFLAPDMPVVLIDEIRLRQIMLNLVGNALKFTEIGGISIHVGFHISDPVQNLGTLVIRVRDSGSGVEEEARKRIFLPFDRGGERDASIREGAGLGLPISAKLAQCMGGDIRLKSRVGVGSEFTLRLERIAYTAAPGGAACDTTAEVAEEIVLLPPCRILVVDDMLLNLKVMEAMLGALGVIPVCCLSGAEALALAKKMPPDILFTDLWMPEMNGEELARQFRECPETEKIPIIALTADMQLEVSWNMKYFNGVLFKPVELDKLRRTIEEKVFAAKNAEL